MNKEFYENIPIGSNLFGRFILLEVIAANESSGIYKCKCNWGEQRGQIIALKVSSSSPENFIIEHQLIKEIQTISSLNSDNIIKAYDWFRDESFIAYSMEYVDGGTLEDLINKSHDNSIAWCIAVASQVATGLKDIHTAGIVHRDIKPQNILVSKHGKIKIADFGISTLQRTKIKEENNITGTVDFLSPEQISTGKCDIRSDIYAWGTLFFYLLTGVVPFADESIIEALARKVNEDAIKVKFIRSDVPQYLSDIIAVCLARDPNHRFQSMNNVLHALSSKSGRSLSKTITFKSFTELNKHAA